MVTCTEAQEQAHNTHDNQRLGDVLNGLDRMESNAVNENGDDVDEDEDDKEEGEGEGKNKQTAAKPQTKEEKRLAREAKRQAKEEKRLAKEEKRIAKEDKRLAKEDKRKTKEAKKEKGRENERETKEIKEIKKSKESEPNCLNVQLVVVELVQENGQVEVEGGQVEVGGDQVEVEGGQVEVEPVKVGKKRGRKPKGGKIVQQLPVPLVQKEHVPNVILHLRCSLKDLNPMNGMCESNSNDVMSYNSFAYASENVMHAHSHSGISGIHAEDSDSVSETHMTQQSQQQSQQLQYNMHKEVCRKLKVLEKQLHMNVSNKRCACFWDTCEFESPPIYIPMDVVQNTYHVYGCFCSPECAAAYLMNEHIDSSTKFERYHLLNNMYGKIYDYAKSIKPACNPFYMLDKFYGNMSIQEYRSLLQNDRLFLIVNKPLTRIMPELHEDNDDFMLNNKTIASNSTHTSGLKKTRYGNSGNNNSGNGNSGSSNSGNGNSGKRDKPSSFFGVV